jgi:hypothetical protein
MTGLFLFATAIGLGLLILAPIPKNRLKRMASRSASTSLFAVGLTGYLYQLIS